MNIIRNRATHAAKLDRWLGPGQTEQMSRSMAQWYGPPIAVAGVPGSVWAHAGGDFRGPLSSGQFANALDFAEMRARRVSRNFARRQMGQCNAGFASLSDIIAEATTGKMRTFSFLKSNTNSANNKASSLWRLGPQPPAGTAPGAAPGGTAFSSSSTGTFQFTNPTGGDTQHLVKMEVIGSTANNVLLLYDLLFGVAKTMNSTATEAVTGVPTRYQSTTPGDPDHAGGNFLFVQTGGTGLPATAHNWTVCQYTDELGNAGVNLPSLTGNASNSLDMLDQPLSTWFAPLDPTDNGIKALTQMQCSALVATGVTWFMIGHPLAFLPCNLAGTMHTFDGIMSAFNLVRIFDSACLAFMTLPQPSGGGAAGFTGQITTVAG